MSDTKEFNCTVVACSLCSNSVIITNKKYEDTINNIEKNSLGQILFRTTICMQCENKVYTDATVLFIIPERGYRIPIGVNIILNWSVYRNISLFVHKYCKLYEHSDISTYAIENRIDILSSIKGDHYIYEFYYDTEMHLEKGNLFNFFLGSDDPVTKRRKINLD